MFHGLCHLSAAPFFNKNTLLSAYSGVRSSERLPIGVSEGLLNGMWWIDQGGNYIFNSSLCLWKEEDRNRTASLALQKDAMAYSRTTWAWHHNSISVTGTPWLPGLCEPSPHKPNLTYKIKKTYKYLNVKDIKNKSTAVLDISTDVGLWFRQACGCAVRPSCLLTGCYPRGWLTEGPFSRQ